MENIVTYHKDFKITVRSEEQGFVAYIKNVKRPSTGGGVSMGNSIILQPCDCSEDAVALAKSAIDNGTVW